MYNRLINIVRFEKVPMLLVKVFFLEGFRCYNLLDGVGCFFAVHFPHPKFLTLKAAI